ncbi:MAG: RluA family pseudouridine synthase [Weeping tea tree witches'-broom phytoplasma]|uniref:RluA family pseudouridine synthase n=1 Tax=Candidatus Phytoplasma melaleucae TaxID=2982630 RepID=UPI00293AEB3D|nr:RluA family pseudouridine synthase [Weeping tea tree witches'-broom phytoplasma]
MKEFLVSLIEQGMRLDRFLAQKMNLSRQKCHNAIMAKNILVNSQIPKKSYLLKKNDLIIVKTIYENHFHYLTPLPLNLEIVYEDDYLAVINKPYDLVVHPSPNYRGVTLVNGLLSQIIGFNKLPQNDRMGIIHRLDKDTTGLIIVGKTEESISKTQKLLQARKIKRFYYALIYGFLSVQGTIKLPIKRDLGNRLKMAVSSQGKQAITHFKTLEKFDNFSLLEVELETGRTHQIRVHFDYLNHPVVGDQLYGKKTIKCKDNYHMLRNIRRQLLHAKKLNFYHPITNQYLQLEIPLPDYFQKALDHLKVK